MGMYSICDMKWTYDAASCPECTKIANRGGPLEAAWAKAKMSLPLGNLIWFYKFIYITYINGPRLPRCFLWRIDHPSSSSSSSPPIQISHPWPELSYCPTLQQAWNLPLAAPARIASEIRAWGRTDNSWAPTLSPVKRRGRTLFRELFFLVHFCFLDFWLCMFSVLFAAFWSLPFYLLFVAFWSWSLPFCLLFACGMLFARRCWLLVIVC